MTGTDRAKLETELAALEAALPFLRQSMSADGLARHIRDCRRELLAGVAAEDTAFVEQRLAGILGPAPPASASLPAR